MFVDTGLLRMGGNESHRAGEHAQEGAGQLARAPLAAGMFGDFAAADDFHEAISSAHAQHVNALQSHHETLNDVGAKTHRAAYEFDAMEDHNTKVLRDV